MVCYPHREGSCFFSVSEVLLEEITNNCFNIFFRTHDRSTIKNKNVSLCNTYLQIMWHMANKCFEFSQKNVGSTLSSAFGNVSQLELGKLQRQQIFLGAKQISISVKKC